MQPRVNYFVVGIFVVILAALGITIGLWLSISQRKPHDTYLLYMREPVSGLAVQAPVKFNGVEVGYVGSIQLNPKDPQQVRLELQIEEGTPINQSTTATLMAQGVTGVTYIGLKAAAPTAPPLPILPGEKYPIIPCRPSLLVQINTALTALTVDMQQINHILHTLFSEQNQTAISASLQNIRAITQTLSDHAPEVGDGIRNANQALQTSKTLMQSLSREAVPNATQMMKRMNQVLDNVQQLTHTLQNNPSALVRGKATEPLGPGER